VTGKRNSLELPQGKKWRTEMRYHFPRTYPVRRFLSRYPGVNPNARMK
jgi:hypothetical protein